MAERATGSAEAMGSSAASQPDADDVDAVTAAVLTASRLLVAISARSIAAVEERVTLPQFRMLVVLANAGEMKLITLAERLAVNPSTAMRMIDRLTTAGLTHRRVNPANRRETLLRLTDAGRQIVDDVTARRRREIATIVARMPSDQRSGLVSALRAFTEAGHEPLVNGPGRDAIPLGWD
ncbi:MAG TPA: MarR family transcriptional regulator [Streptosporangiaceae bacterium]